MTAALSGAGLLCAYIFLLRHDVTMTPFVMATLAGAAQVHDAFESGLTGCGRGVDHRDRARRAWPPGGCAACSAARANASVVTIRARHDTSHRVRHDAAELADAALGAAGHGATRSLPSSPTSTSGSAPRDLESFYRSGTDEIAAVLQRADEYGIAVPRRRALDFGCGVGRLTLALAEQFDRCDGVDISPAMLKVARQRCTRPERCHFHRNVAEDLSLFGDASFTLHLLDARPAAHGAAPEHRLHPRDGARARRRTGCSSFSCPVTPSGAKHRQTTFACRWPGHCRRRHSGRGLSVPCEALKGHAGERMLLDVTVENQSAHVWPSLPDARDRYQINVANRWLDEQGALLQRDDERCSLPFDVPPGGGPRCMLGVRPPPVNGRYLLEIDLVQENVGWFAEHGSPTLRIGCDVSGGVDGPALTPIAAPAAAPAGRRFSERHPRAFAVLRASGLRDLYWTARRMLDRVKSRRDAVIRARLHPVMNWWERVSFAPRMEMHCVPTADVRAIVEASGGRVVRVEEELMPGGYQSCRYWVTRVQPRRVTDKVSILTEGEPR